MSKKFSTMLASVLLASAFSSSAYAATNLTKGLNGAKEGDVVAFFTAGTAATALQIKTSNEGVQTLKSEDVGNIFAGVYGTNVFGNALAGLWKIASVKTGESGVPVYQFVNKATGAYLAIDLETAPDEKAGEGEMSKSKNPATLSRTGNKNWSIDANGALYAYDRDSIFSLNAGDGNGLLLQAKKGVIGGTEITDGAQAMYVATLDKAIANALTVNASVALTATGFNDLMALQGSNGKLNFNNNKDVSSTQKNILKDVKWEAKAGTTENVIYLTNGKSVEGYNDNDTEKLQKPIYLMVDTAYYDDNASAYFKLTTDTLGVGIGAANEDGKHVNKRPWAAAQFTVAYFYANDSIAIKTANAPKVNGNGDFYPKASSTTVETEAYAHPIALRSLADVTVLTVGEGASAASANGYVFPLIQPYATAGGDATDIKTAATVYNLQVKNVEKGYTPQQQLRAITSATDKYLVAEMGGTTDLVDEVDASNVWAQWALIPGEAGTYSIVNRADADMVYYTGPDSKLKHAKGKVLDNTYALNGDTLKLAAVTLNADNVYEEKEGNKKVKYDYSGTFYAGTGEMEYKSFAINPVSAFMSSLAVQFNKDSVMILGDAADAPVWRFEKGDADTYGLEIEGIPSLKAQSYKIYTADAEVTKYYVYNDGNDVFAVTK